ncbi:MAG: DUF3592 domain-containing protein [Firmicutes bacterium]|nr:DUF3592 domain-containing protein [Bacillota bacterium]
MGSAGKFVKNKGSEKNTKFAFCVIGIVFVVIGLLMLYSNIRTKQTCDKTPAVITRLGSGKHKSRAYVEYTYKDKVYNSALSYYNAFTMKEGKPITVYIDPARPDFPKVPTNGMIILFEGMGIMSIVFVMLGDAKNDI